MKTALLNFINYLDSHHLLWVFPAFIVLAGLLTGVSDVLRLSPGRVMAIASVCFRESIRRRVLLVVPLAILGVLAVSAFQNPVDPQDAIRQQLKFCLFASGLIVVLTVLILSSTNLPREIDNRVIYTIVTKPTSRLEIVLGKVLGFSGISALVLLIMGLFTWGYLGVRSAQYQSAITKRLAEGSGVSVAERSTLESYRKFGLLTARYAVSPVQMQVVSQVPDPGDKVLWMSDSNESDVVLPFNTQADLFSNALPQEGAKPNEVEPARLAIQVQFATQPLPGKAPTPELPQAGINISIGNAIGEVVVDSNTLNARDVRLALDDNNVGHALVIVPRGQVKTFVDQPRLTLVMTAAGRDYRIGVLPEVAKLVLVDPQGNVLATQDGKPAVVEGLRDPRDSTRQLAILRGRYGIRSQQIHGDAKGHGTIAFYRYRNTGFSSAATGDVSGEFRMQVERAAADDEADDEIPTRVQVTVYNRSKTGEATAPVTLDAYPENNRPMYISVPAQAIAGGDFDIAVKCLSTDHWVSIGGESAVQLVRDREPFAWNLLKSLSILWMMSLLVIVTAICCSTFLSWPIAVMLTLVILLARWGVVQLGDTITPGIGNQVSTQLGFRDAATSVAVSKSVEALSSLLRTLAAVLPDLTQFDATGAIERGLQVQLATMAQGGMVLLFFGLPLLVAGYVFLRYKEVAP
jgi:hypothetical protein